VSANPFGSFRHNGTFPASFISGSVTSRHLGGQQSSTYDNSTQDPIMDDSTHLYINMLDRSDVGAIKSTKFWCDSDDASEFSSIVAEEEMIEHRINMMYETNYCLSNQDRTMARELVRRSVVVSLSKMGVVTTKPPIAPKIRKQKLMKKVTTESAISLEDKVGPWLERVRPSECEDVQTPEDSLCNETTSICSSRLSGEPDSPGESQKVDSTVGQLTKESDSSAFMRRPMVSCGIIESRQKSKCKFLRRIWKWVKVFSCK